MSIKGDGYGTEGSVSEKRKGKNRKGPLSSRAPSTCCRIWSVISEQQQCSSGGGGGIAGQVAPSPPPSQVVEEEGMLPPSPIYAVVSSGVGGGTHTCRC